MIGPVCRECFGRRDKLQSAEATRENANDVRNSDGGPSVLNLRLIVSRQDLFAYPNYGFWMESTESCCTDEDSLFSLPIWTNI